MGFSVEDLWESSLLWLMDINGHRSTSTCWLVRNARRIKASRCVCSCLLIVAGKTWFPQESSALHRHLGDSKLS